MQRKSLSQAGSHRATQGWLTVVLGLSLLISAMGTKKESCPHTAAMQLK